MGGRAVCNSLTVAEGAELISLLVRQTPARRWRYERGSCWPAPIVSKTSELRRNWRWTRSAGGGTLCRASDRRFAGRAALRCIPDDRRSVHRGHDGADVAKPATGCDALEFAHDGTRVRLLGLDVLASVAGLGFAASSNGDVQAVDRPELRRRGTQLDWALSFAVGACRPAVHGRKFVDLGTGPQSAHAANASGPYSSPEL